MSSELFHDRLQGHLAFIYGEERAPELLQRLLQLVDRHLQKRQGDAPAKPLWDESDNLLITYGNSIQYPGMNPLASLKQFLDRRLQGAISRARIRGKSPWASGVNFHSTSPRIASDGINVPIQCTCGHVVSRDLHVRNVYPCVRLRDIRFHC